MSVKSVRVFKTTGEDESELVYEFRRPTQVILSKAELASRVRFSEAFRAGIILADEAKKLLKERNLWGDEQEEAVSKFRDEIQGIEDKLKDATLPNDEGLDLVDKLRAKRSELQDYTQLLETVTGGTCESVAAEEKTMFLASECTYNKTTGEKVYKSLEDFKARIDEVATVETYREATIASLEVMIGEDLPSDLTTQYTENKWLAERGLNEEDDNEDAADESESKPEPKPKAKRKVSKKKTKQTAAS